MSNKPCEIIPIPKKYDLHPTEQPWPRQIEVTCEVPAAEPLRNAYASDLGGRADGVMSVRLGAGDLPASCYELDFGESHVDVRAGDINGFRYALNTLKQIASSGRVPTGRICDGPTLRFRGFHLNFDHYRRMGIDEALRLMQAAAAFKLNVLLVEYGSRFPFTSHPQLRDDLALTPDDIGRLNSRAAELGIKIIPFQQSIAHLEFALRHPHLAHLRERPEKSNLLCPLHPESLPLFKALAQDILALHPNAKYFHLGADEARKIGACSRCAPIAKQEGVGALFGRYIGEATRWILEKGLRPIVWDDTFCAFPAALEHLPKETIIQYWDYIAVSDPTPVLIPRMAHLDGAPRVCHDWRWTVADKRGKVPDVQRDVMKNYSEPARLKTALGKPYMAEFGRYLGGGFPRWIRALPYLEYYQDRGHDVITSPTAIGNGDTKDGVPNFTRFEHNIRTHARRCTENKSALGIISTAWYNMPPEILYQPLMVTAMSAW
ncbi:MAG TPA: family 20 glycosylhydrolase [Phycisphaerae bacterium]|nr:family 20 glycosylhydrolase [Phycisphaerae bacterium]